MKHNALWLSLALVVIASGCAHKQPMSMEELNRALASNQTAASRFYPDKTPEQVKIASQKVLYLLDPPDMTFDVSESKVYAKRRWLFYAVLSAALGVDQYNVSVAPKGKGTVSTFAFSEEGNVLISPPNVFKKNLEVGAHENPADFKLFHDRVEYILGMRSEWATCEAAKATTKKPMALCDAIGLENLSPLDERNGTLQ